MDDEGQPVVGETLVYLLNGGPEIVDFVLPAFEPGLTWTCLIDTFDLRPEQQTLTGGQPFRLRAHSLALFLAVPDRADV